MRLPRSTPAKALAAVLGLAVILTPAGMASAAKKAPAKRACALKAKAKCKKATLTRVKVGKVNVAGADLSGAVISGATFSGTNLTGANLSGATITNTTFTGVKVGNLNLSGARLSNVKFVRASAGSGQTAMARQNDCTAEDAGPFTEEWSLFTCSGGGVNMRGARIAKSISFLRSVIPNSDFRDLSAAAGSGQGAQLVLDGTDARESNFTGSQVLIGTRGNLAGPWIDSNVSGAVFNGALMSTMTNTVATNASFMGATWAAGTLPGPNSHVDLTGTRGLFGATSVLVVPAIQVPQVVATNIHEDGYWKTGVLCVGTSTSIPCEDKRVAVGQPVVVLVNATSPVEVTAPVGWTCTREPGSGDHPYVAKCTIPVVTDDSAMLIVHRYTPPPATRQVLVQSLGNGGMGTVDAHIWIDSLGAGGAVVTTKECASAPSCSTTVDDGTPVRVRMEQLNQGMPDGEFMLWCPGEVVDGQALNGHWGEPASGFPPPSYSYSCPAYTVNADTTATSWAS